MKLYNSTRHKAVAADVMVANNFFTRLRGLLGKKDLGSEQCMVIYPCNSIHTFFMAFPIDVAFLDKDNKVVDVAENIMPGHVSRIVKRAHSVVEMPANKIREASIKIGDKLVLN